LYVLDSRVNLVDTVVSANGDTSSDYGFIAVGTRTRINISESRFDSNAGYGLHIGNEATATVLDSEIQRNGNTGIVAQQANVTIEGSSIVSNTNFGINNTSNTQIVQAVNNWWGHPSGPRQTISNTDGLGNAVSDNVDFDPWLVAPPRSRQAVALTLGQPLADNVAPNAYKDYQLNVSAGQSLIVEVAPSSNTDALWLFGRVDDLPLWTRFDLRTQTRTPRGVYQLLLSPQESATYYFSVYGRSVAASGANYQISVRSADQYLSSLTPRTSGNAGQTTLTLSGLGFVEGIQVQLRRADQTAINAVGVTAHSSTEVWARFNLQGANPGLYDVWVIWPQGTEANLAGSFTLSAGVGPKLNVRLLTPDAVRAGRSYIMWLEFSNVGDADLPLSLLKVSADGAMLKFPDQPDFTSSSVQLFAVRGDGPLNALPPGTSNRIPLSFRPGNTTRVTFTIARSATLGNQYEASTMSPQPTQPSAQTQVSTSSVGVLPSPTPSALQVASQSLAGQQTGDIQVTNKMMVGLEHFYAPDIQRFLERRGSGLARFKLETPDGALTAAELIMNASIGYDYMLNPKILIALLESISGLISNPAPTQDQLDYALGNHDPDVRGFDKQLRWAAQQLGQAYERNAQRAANTQPQFEWSATLAFNSMSSPPEQFGRNALAPYSAQSVARTYRLLFPVSAQTTASQSTPITLDQISFLAKPFKTHTALHSLIDHDSGNASVLTFLSEARTDVQYLNHHGLDYLLAPNTTVYPAAKGKVAGYGSFSNICYDGNENKRGATKWVAIDHYLNDDDIPDVRTRYLHLNSIGTPSHPLKVGADIDPNTPAEEPGLSVVGLSGNTGLVDPCPENVNDLTTGAHLHLDASFNPPESRGAFIAFFDPFGWWSITTANDPLLKLVKTDKTPPGNSWLWSSSKTVDNLDASFERVGVNKADSTSILSADASSAYLFKTAGELAIWGLKAPQTGNYGVEVFIPNIPNTAFRPVSYEVRVHSRSTPGLAVIVSDLSTPIQQNDMSVRGQWVRLGSASSQLNLERGQIVLVMFKTPEGDAKTFAVADQIRLTEIPIQTTPVATQETLVIRAFDPNDKIGPAGVGPSRIITAQQPLYYIVNFENMSSATAPVQELIITDALDANLDWATLELVDLTFSSQTIAISTGQYEFSTRFIPPIASVVGSVQGQMAIDVNAKLDPKTGLLEWRLRAIDTATDEPPEDARAGFLPPENGTGRGQGHVSFLIKPKPGVALGTRITNKASIVFDTNAPIGTNEVWNIVGIPTRKVYLPLVLKLNKQN
jgi:murein DD-endopeptidase MepM/ murein hydrolase activator NlpD